MPVMVRTDYTVKAIESLYQGSTGHFDNLIIFIDGLADDETVSKVKGFYETYDQNQVSLVVLRSHSRVGVNQARMDWIRAARNKKLFIVNDDILVSQWRDKELDKLLDDNRVVCPMFTLWDKDFAWKPQKKSDNIAWHAWWLDLTKWWLLGDIPKSLKIWYWDDWVWRRCNDLWHPCKWTDNIIVHHYVSKTVYNDAVKQKVLWVVETDKQARIQIVKQMGRYDTRYSHL